MMIRQMKRMPFSQTLLLLIVATGVLLSAQAGAPETAAQKTYATPDAAVEALITALRDNDFAGLTAVFGPDSDDIVTSGDEVADATARTRFVDSYDAAHALVIQDDGSYVLEVGLDGWPSPIPIVSVEGQWRFDTAAGIDEVVYRRIGRNEIGAIETCLGIVAAQQEYASTSHDGQPVGIYAQKLISDPGKRNGLYWEPVEGQRASPIGPFIAQAVAEGYLRADGSRPYHGYIYRLLKAQGSAATGGAKQYIIDGVMSGGYAVIAYPVEYQLSGVASFIVNQDGIVYQKNLGPETATIAAAIDAFNPDGTWAKIETNVE